MKSLLLRGLFSYMLLMLSAVMLFSCSNNDNSDYVSITPQDEIYLEPKASTVTLCIESSDRWSVVGLPTWIKAEPLSGNSGDRLIITVSENSSLEERYATLTVTCGTATAVLMVTQYGNIETDYVDVGFDKPGVSYTYSESTGNLSLTYNGASKPAVIIGSAIVLPSEYGYDIRVVESISSNGNTINMSTKEGNMCNLFRNIDFTLATTPDATRSAVDKRIFTPVSCGYRDEQGIYHEIYNRDTRASYTSSEKLWSFTEDFNGERLYDGVAGTLYWEKCQYDAGLDATLKFDFGEKEITPELVVGDLLSFGYNITGNVGIDMLLHYNYGASYSEEDDDIIRRNLVWPVEIKFIVGNVPVFVTVNTHLGKSYHFEAKGAIDATTGVKCTNEISVGLEWSKESGVTASTPTSQSQFTVYPPTLKAEASVEAKVSYYPQIEMKLYKFLGPFIEPRPYLSDNIEAGLRVSADGENFVGWTAGLNGGIDLRFGIDLAFSKWEKEIWSSKIYNLVDKNFYNAPARITKLSPEDGREVEEGESVAAEFLVESYCSLTKEYYPCPLTPVLFETECGELEKDYRLTDAEGKVKVNWIPAPYEQNYSKTVTRAAEFVERTLTASIVDKDGELIDDAKFMVKIEDDNASNDVNNEYAVDLGLSVKWARCNVGATMPEDYGGYYSWGETEEKNIYNSIAYKWYKYFFGSDSVIVTKYCTDSEYGRVDNKTVLELEDDVAHVKWGGSWRMPTLEEQKELIERCKWEWTELNGVKGRKVTGPNGNSIFLPAAGSYFGEWGPDNRGIRGGYWSSSLYVNNNKKAHYIDFMEDFVYGGDDCWFSRDLGRTVRPVCE